jgi:hypothetical protein
MAAETAADINDLPDSDFAYIAPGGTVVGGKTTPRSLRHYPIHDAAHVRNALARASAAENVGGEEAATARKALPAIKAAAAKMGIGSEAKTGEAKAEPFDSAAQYDRWFGGLVPRRVLMVPFGGEITSPYNPLGKARTVETPYGGMDIDLEFFHPGTDLYGDFPALKASRERITDWHHRVDPVGPMRGQDGVGVVIGKSVMDDHPETVILGGLPYAGIWGDFWLNAGEKRRALVAMMERNLGAQLYASTEPVKGSVVRNRDNRHQIDRWAVYKNTITTSPQNGLAILPELKAVLDSDTELGVGGLKALLTGLDATGIDLRSTFPELGGDTFPDPSGENAAKAGRVLSHVNESALRKAMDELAAVLGKLVSVAAEPEAGEGTTDG